MKLIHSFIGISILFMSLSLSCSCAGSSATKNTPGHIEGNAGSDVSVSIFNGITTREINVSGGRFRALHTATEGLYEAVFFLKDNFYPKIVIVRASEEPVKVNAEFTQKLKGESKGILAGIVFKPVIGGKLREHTGILKTFKGIKVNILKDGVSYTAVTDKAGVFVIELPEGEYDVVSSGQKADKAIIREGKTTIKNIQKGIRLID